MKLTKLAFYLSLSLAVSACGEKVTVEGHLANAQKYQSENKLKESEIELKNAIKLDPSNSEARFQFGRLYLSQGSGLNAVKELEKAQSLKYNEGKLLPLLARAYLISDDFEGVLELSEKAEKLPNEIKVEFLSYKTLSAIRTNQIDLAKESNQEASELIAGNPHSLLANGYLALVDGDVDKALSFTEKSLSLNPKNPEAVMFQGQIFSQMQDFENAGISYKKYAELQPQSRIIYLVLADTLVKTDNYLEAEKYAEMILQALPNQPVASYVKAVARFAEKDYALASEFAEKALLSDYKTPHLKLVAGASAFYLKKYEQANLHLGSIVKQLVSEHPARKMYAVSQFQLGLIDDITETLGDFTPTTEADAQFMSSLSFSLYSIGATEEAKTLANKANSQEKTNASTNTRKGILKLMMNDPSGIENLEQAVSENPEMAGAELALAYAAMESGDFEKALGIANRWQEKSPEKAEGYNMSAAIKMRQGKIADAQQALLISLEKEPNNLFAITEIAKIYYQQGDIDTAKQYSDTAIELYPDNVKALRYSHAVNKTPESLGKVSTAYQNNKENIEISILYMEALAQSKDFKKMLEVSAKMPDSIKTPKKIWQLRVMAYQKLKDGNNIQLTLNKWMKTNPYHIEPVFLLADIYNKTNQQKKAISIVNKALKSHHKDNVNLKMVKMQLLLDNRLVGEAKTLLAELSSEKIDETLRAGINGRIALLEGDFKKALPLLKTFYDKYQSSQNVILLSVAMQETGKKEEGIGLLEAHLVKQENDHRVRNLLASLYIQNDRNKALIQYQQIVKDQPLNIVALNNLAWLTMERGELKEALVYCEKAYELAPNVANVVDTYSQVLLKLDKKREALAKSKEAYDLSKGEDVDVALNYIEILMVNKRNNEAKTLLAKVMAVTGLQKTKKAELLNKI
jgi:putative PEP-CTERM system TPR-repeat lipoprotein